MKQTKSSNETFWTTLMVSMVCVLILCRNSVCLSSSCTSDLDCSLNGRCVNRAKDSAQPQGLQDSNYQWLVRYRAEESLSSSAGCLCKKPWSGDHCEELTFLPTMGKNQVKNPFEVPTASSSFAPQGYGMIPNITTWGGGLLIEPINKTSTLYHLYVSRMTNDCLLENWGTNSRVDHAVSTSINGPFEFSDVAIPTFSHNPSPVVLRNATTGRFAIFHIGDGATGPDGGKDCRSRSNNDDSSSGQHNTGVEKLKTHRKLLREGTMGISSGIHVSDSFDGPWEPVLDHNLDCNNPAPWVHPTNGTIFVLCSHGGIVSQLYKSHYGNIAGPYEFVTEFKPGERTPSKNPLHTAYEDPFLYTDANGNFHIIYHAYQYTGQPSECQNSVVSAHAYSLDGYEWHVSQTPPYGSQIEVSFPISSSSNRKREMSTSVRVTLATRERPKLIVSDGVITHMVEGVCGAPGCPHTDRGHARLCKRCKESKNWEVTLPSVLDYEGPGCRSIKHPDFCVDCKYRNWDFTMVSTLDAS